MSNKINWDYINRTKKKGFNIPKLRELKKRRDLRKKRFEKIDPNHPNFWEIIDIKKQLKQKWQDWRLETNQDNKARIMVEIHMLQADINALL